VRLLYRGSRNGDTLLYQGSRNGDTLLYLADWISAASSQRLEGSEAAAEEVEGSESVAPI